MRVKNRMKQALLTIVVLAFGLPVVLVFILKFVNPPFWGWKMSRTLFPPQGYPEYSLHKWVPLENTSPALPMAIMASEDQQFPEHWGIDLNALISVLKESGESGPKRGASTITQQTAKNVFLFPSHTYVRKVYELYLTLLIEMIWSKERIMEVYLNVVEFGPGIYGVQAASHYYFGVSANNLTQHQAAQLAVVLPNPYKIKPTPMTRYVQQRVNWILNQMRNLGTMTL